MTPEITRIFKQKSFISSLVTKTVHLFNLGDNFLKVTMTEIYRDGSNIDKYLVLPFKPSLDKSTCVGHIQCLTVEVYLCIAEVRGQ